MRKTKCGAGFRKPVSEISDRAKRYRAHSPGCEPPGPRKCFKCGSRRFVVPDHVDGDESNGRRSNLRWACKRHNTILGKRMAKAGKGVRTRQYNPADVSRVWANLSFAEREKLLRAAGINSSSMVKIGDWKYIPPLSRKKLLSVKNPGAVNLAQYIQAAVDHSRGAHDAGGLVIHETPKAKRREFAREIWWRRGVRNPRGVSCVENPKQYTLWKDATGKYYWEISDDVKVERGIVNADAWGTAGNRALAMSAIRAALTKGRNPLAGNEFYAVAKNNRVISHFYQKIINARKAAKQLGGAIIKVRPGDVGAGGVLYGGTYVTPRGFAVNPSAHHEILAAAGYQDEGRGVFRDREGNKVKLSKSGAFTRTSKSYQMKVGKTPDDLREALRNPRGKNPSEADDLYRKFHGRGPDKITTMLVSGIDPYGGHPELTSLGPLIRLVVGEDVELDKNGEVTAADWVNEITFVPSMAEYRKITGGLDPHDGEQLRKFKAWLKQAGAPDVAAVPNTRQLYFVGGKQDLSEKELIALGADPEKDLADLGFCYLIEYFAQKRFDRFEPTTYFHAFGEKTDVQPRLIWMRVPKLFLLSGGEYVVRSVGIDN